MQLVANIPAEITHLLEEIQAKDLQIQAFKDEINKRDAQLQKWVRMNGGHVLNPKEEAFSKTINDCYDKCEILQAEKCGLSEKAMIVLDRQVKRLDIGLRGLTQSEQFPVDWAGPTLLSGSGNVTGVNTPATGGGGAVHSGMPLQAMSNNIATSGGAPNVANAAQIRIAQSTGVVPSRGNASGSQTPTAIPRTQREGSSEANKRRKLNASLGTLPAASSNLRQSSLGPGTPRAGTPGTAAANSSRAGSAQPARPGGVQKKAPSTGLSRKVAPPPSKKGNIGNGRVRASGTSKKGDRRRQLARDRNTPSTNASGSGSEDDDSNSPSPSSIVRNQGDGAGDKPEEDDGDDDQIYCICQKVSFGDMVGCDNDNCEYQWFHYKCVGVTEEPVGEWLCPSCRVLPRSKLKITKD